MKSIKEIYELYNIPLNLQEHQLQVTSVASWIVDHWQGVPIEKEQIIYGALFHDMGNIIKFNFSPEHTPFNYTVEEKLYWEKIQKFFIEKYGTNVHHATQVIVKEIGDPYKISGIVGGLGFYPHWAHIGWHLDIRPNRLYWYCDSDGSYNYGREEIELAIRRVVR